MSLITRQGKGKTLTIAEMDSNLIYLESLSASYRTATSSIIDWSKSSAQEIEITSDTEFQFQGAIPGQKLTLVLNQTGNGTIVWPDSIKWTNGQAPDYSVSMEIDLSFNIESGFNDEVDVINLLPNGKILVGGYFDEYDGNSIGIGIARLNSDGSLDETFNIGSGFYNSDWDENGAVNVIAIQSNGKILVGGYFDEYDGDSIGYGIARLNSDGSLDETFNIGSGFNEGVRSIAIQSNGKILVGGYSDEYDGDSIGIGIARLNSNGSLDRTFNIGSGFYNSDWDENGTVNVIIIQPTGKILVGGRWDEYRGSNIGGGIARLNSNGSIDGTFTVGSGFYDDDDGSPARIDAMEIQPDGKLLVGGRFDEYDGNSIGYGITRLNSDGSLDGTFNIGSGFNRTIRSIAIQEDGKILVGGYFDGYNGDSIGYGIARLNSDGTLDETFSSGIGFNDDVQDITVTDNNKILVGGFFNEYDGSTIGDSLVKIMDPTTSTYRVINFYYNGVDFIGTFIS